MTYEESVKKAKEIGFRFERQSFSTTYDVRDKSGKWLCFDHNLPTFLSEYLKQ